MPRRGALRGAHGQQCNADQQLSKTLFKVRTFDRHLISHDIYRRGDEAPIVLLREFLVIGQETLSLADGLVNAGFEVVMPHLFGPLGETSIGRNLVRVMFRRKIFRLMSSDQSSPRADSIGLFRRVVTYEKSARGVGVISMCLTAP